MPRRAYLMIRTRNRSSATAVAEGKSDLDAVSNHCGDVIEVRPLPEFSLWQTPQERRDFFFWYVRGIPDDRYDAIVERLLGGLVSKDPDSPVGIYRHRPRNFGLGGPDMRRPQVIARLEARFPEHGTIFADFFNAKTTQPLNRVPSNTWQEVRGLFFNKVADRDATRGEMGDP